MKAFTLIELLVYIAILLIVVTLSMQFILAVIEANGKANAKEEVQVNTQAVLQAFDFATRHAQGVYDPTSDFVNDPGQLSLVSTRDVPAGETQSYLDMYIDDDRLCVKKELTGVECVTSSRVKVTSLMFNKIMQPGGAESVQMLFTLRFDSARAEYYFPQTVQTSARLRAY